MHIKFIIPISQERLLIALACVLAGARVVMLAAASPGSQWHDKRDACPGVDGTQSMVRLVHHTDTGICWAWGFVILRVLLVTEVFLSRSRLRILMIM